MSTSGNFLFASPQSEQLITDAYERVGILPDLITQQKIQTAQRSINFILNSWINKGLNLWTVQQGMLNLQNNQSSYNLPLYTSDILEATIRTSIRNLGGTAFSSAGGVAQNAFDGNPATACIQTSTDGYISYQWGQSQYAIAMVGIQSNINTNYTLVFEYSLDNINWFEVSSIPEQSYSMGIVQWFVVTAPVLGNNFRVRETGGSTLNVQELYFNTMLYDTIITRLSRAEYIALPNKSQVGRPTSFYVNRQINPTVTLWPTPNYYYNNMFYTYVEQMQDIGALMNNAQIPARFLEALCSRLTHMLSIKEKLEIERIQYLGALADQEYVVAGQEDRERVPLRIFGDYTQGWAQI
jgi:hypothetical protein